MFSKQLLVLLQLLHFIFPTNSQVFVEQTDVTVGGDSFLRVVQGWPVQLGEVPYQVSFKVNLRAYFESFCGGTLIKPSKILTAAHCFVDDKGRFCLRKITIRSSGLSKYAAVMGSLHNRIVYNKKGSNEGQWRRLKNFTRPRSYNFPINDIGIVFTAIPFQINTHVRPIPYATIDEDYVGTCQVSGYGLTGPNVNSPKSPVLQAGHVEVVNQYQCARLFMRKLKNEICAMLDKSYPARGDSGGPLVCKRTGNTNEDPEKGILVGIVSSYVPERGCSFTRVSSFSRYIARNGSPRIVFVDLFGLLPFIFVIILY